MSLEDAVAALPEKYQPIYGHEELSDNAARSSDDRLKQIIRVYDLLSAHLKRPLRVLDIGCAQGFFCFSLAAKGAVVTGIDMDQRNIDVCESLKSVYADYKVNFRTQRAERAILDLQDGQYDIVLGFSVFHHITHDNGLYYAIDLVRRIAENTAVLIAELALNTEPLYWARHLPVNERDLLKPFPFVVEVARHDTHLSNIQRPIFVASARYCILENYIQTFSHWSTKSNALAVDAFKGSRSYFSNDHAIVKVYRFGGDCDQINRRDMEQERRNLLSLPAETTRTSLLTHLDTASEGWNIIKRTPGVMLSTMIAEGIPFDPNIIIGEILRQLAFYESLGLYHNDVRTWNIIVDQVGNATLIDLASLTEEKTDCSWPRDLFLSFFMLLREVTILNENFDGVGAPHRRQNSMVPFSLPKGQREWAIKFWRRPPSEWSFANFLEDFDSKENTPKYEECSFDLWALAMESISDEQQRQILGINWRLEQLRQDMTTKQGDNLTGRLPSKDEVRLEDLTKEVAAIREELSIVKQERDRFTTQITSMAQGPGGLAFHGSQLRTIVGVGRDNSISTTGAAGALAFGPYTPLRRGAYQVSFLFSDVVSTTDCVVDIVASFGQDVLLPATPIIPTEGQTEWTFEVATERDYMDVEFRVMAGATTQLALTRVSLKEIPD